MRLVAAIRAGRVSDVIYAVFLPRFFPKFAGKYQEKERHDDLHVIAGHGLVAQVYPRQQDAECTA